MNFWEYESRDTYRARQAERWAEEKRRDAREMLQRQSDLAAGASALSASPLSEFNSFADWETIKKEWLGEVLPEPKKKSGGGGVLGAIDGVTSTIFGGEVRQPWDLLRPVQRALDAEQKYIAKPLAKFGYETISGNDYEDLPSFIQFGLEGLTSPSSWIGPGLVGKLAKGAKFAPLAKYASSESLTEYLAKGILPSITAGAASGAAQEVGLPALATAPLSLATGHFTNKGLNYAFGRPGSLSRIKPGSQMHIVIPDEYRVYHGTMRDIDDLNFSAERAHTTSFPDSLYVSGNPRVANAYAGANGPLDTLGKKPENDQWWSQGGRVFPMVLMPGTKIFDPLNDEAFPNALDMPSIARRYQHPLDEIIKLRSDLHDISSKAQHGRKGYALDEISPEHASILEWPVFDSISPNNKSFLKKYLEDQGYQGINGIGEMIIFDKNALRPLYSITGRPDAARQLASLSKRDKGFALVAPSIAELLGGSPASARVLNMVGDQEPTARQGGAFRRADKTQPDVDAPYIDRVHRMDLVGAETELKKAQDDLSEAQDRYTRSSSGRAAVDVSDYGERVRRLQEVVDEKKGLRPVELTPKERASLDKVVDTIRKRLPKMSADDIIAEVNHRRNHPAKTPAGRLADREIEKVLTDEFNGRQGPPSLEDQLRMSVENPQGAKQAGRVLAADNAARIEADSAEAKAFYNSDEVKQLMQMDGQKLVRELSKAAKALNDNNTPENLKRVQMLRRVALRRFPQPKGGAPESERMQNLLDAFADSDAEDLFGLKSRQEAIDLEYYARSESQKARRNIANWMRGSETGTNIINFLNQRGIRLEDSDIVHLVNFWSRKVGLGQNYGAKESDIMRQIRESGNKTRVLTTEEIKHKPQVPGAPWNPLDSGSTATSVTDASLIADARALAESMPDLGIMSDGVLHLSDLMRYRDLFPSMNLAQKKLLDDLDSVMRPHRTMEAQFGFEPQENEFGFPVHHQLMTSLQPLDETGVMRESSAGPVVSRRIGSSQGAGTPDLQPSLSAGFMHGNKYLPFEEAQSARIAQGYRRMADDWLMRAVEDMGKKSSDFIPKSISDNLKAEKNVGNQLGSMSNMIARATAPKSAGLKMPKWKPVTPELEALRNDIISADKMKPGASKKKEFATLGERVKLLQADSKKRFSALELSKAKALADKGVYNKEFNGRFYPADIGEALNEINRVDTPDAISRRLNTFNETIRPIMATLDASFVGVQGLIALMSRPSSFFTAIGNLTSNGYNGYIERKLADGTFDRFIQSGGHWAARNDFAEFLAPSALQRVPGIGNLVKGSNDMFVRFGNIVRMEMFDRALALDPRLLGNSDDAITRRMQLARTVGLISGYTPKNPSQIERTFLFAPRFFRSQLGLLADAVSKHDLGDTGAARSLATFVMGGTAAVFAANEALGNETDIDPNSPNFLRVRIGSQDISPFGVWDTLVRAIAKSSDGSEDGLEYLARVKASPAIRTLWDVWEGESLSGDQLDASSPGALIESAAKIAAGYGPISGSTLVTKPPDFSDPTSVAGTGLQFLGVKSSPLSKGEEMSVKREELAQGQFNTAWGNLEPWQKDKLRQENDLEVESTREISKQFDMRSAISERFQTKQEQIDSALPPGPEWREAYAKLNRERTGAYGQWSLQSPEAQASITSSKPRNRNDAARQAYYGIFDKADKEGWTQDELSENIEDFMAALTPEQTAYIERNSGLRDTPRVKEYKAAQKVLRPYWNIADEVWDRFSSRLDPSIKATNLQEYVNELTEQMRAEGLDDRLITRRIQSNNVLREIDRATRTLRERYRRAHPEADAELVKWYGYRSVSNSAA